MSVTVITPPRPLVELAEAKAYLRVDGNDEDVLISGLIAAAEGTIDGPHGWVRRSFGVQTLECAAPSFDPDCQGGLHLPYPPIIEVISVSYTGADGVVQTVSPDHYQINGERLVLSRSLSRPTIGRQSNAVRVRYRAGYEPISVEGQDRSTLPPQVKEAVLAMVAARFDRRGEVVDLHAISSPLIGGLKVWEI